MAIKNGEIMISLLSMAYTEVTLFFNIFFNFCSQFICRCLSQLN